MANGRMKYPKPLPFPLDRQPFTMEQARKAHISRARSRAPDLQSPNRGIRIPTAADFNLLETCRVHVSLTPDSVISHITAAKLHGLFLPTRFDNSTVLDISRNVGMTPPRRRNVRGHKLVFGPRDIDVLGGVAITSAQRTLIDIAPLLSIDELVIVIDQIVCEHHGTCVRTKFPMIPMSTLSAYIALHSGGRGMRKLNVALLWARIGSDSPPETTLRLIIARSPLPDFEPNIELKDATGKARVAPDLSCEEYKTCAEYDGGHHLTPEQQGKDHDRDYVTKSLGWHQVLINKADMRAGEAVVVTKLARMLVQGGWPDPQNLAGRSLLGRLNTRKDFD